MNLTIARYVVPSVLIAALLIYAFWKHLSTKAKLLANDKSIDSDAKITCKVLSCGVWFKRSKTDSDYCAFHKEVLEYQKIIIKNKSPMVKKAKMYAESDARQHLGPQKEKILNELKKEVDKINKKNK